PGRCTGWGQWRGRPSWASRGTRPWPPTASAWAGASARPPWRPTAATRAPTGSPPWRWRRARRASRWDGGRRTRWQAWASRWPSAAGPATPPATPTAGPVHPPAPGVLRTAARDIYRRLMDAVSPELVSQAEAVVAAVLGVQEVGQVRVRWIGHDLRAEVRLVVDADLTVVQAHDIAEAAHHRLLHE